MSAVYRFGVLSYRPSLYKRGTAQPVAVVVEGDEGTVAMGTHPAHLSGVSEFGQAALQELPSLIAEQIQEAIESGDVDVFDHLNAAHQWNLFLSETATVRREDDLPLVAFQLFLEHVLSAYIDDEQLSAPLERYTAAQDNIFYRQARQSSPRRAARA